MPTVHACNSATTFSDLRTVCLALTSAAWTRSALRLRTDAQTEAKKG